jgi:hypothetical protein
MEIKSEYSRITLEKDQLVSEVNNVFSKNRTKKYNTINYTDIKNFKVTSWKPAAYVIYIFGLGFIGYGFSEKEHELNGVFYRVPATSEEIVVYSIFGALIIGLGYYYFHLKYGKFKTLSVQHFEGKNKNTAIFTSENEKEIIDLKRELEYRVYKK